VLIPCDMEARKQFTIKNVATSYEKHVLASDNAIRGYMSTCSGILPTGIRTPTDVHRLVETGLVLTINVPNRTEPLTMHMVKNGNCILINGSCKSKTAKANIFSHPLHSSVVVIGLDEALLPTK
jgi:hypothetical protein